MYTYIPPFLPGRNWEPRSPSLQTMWWVVGRGWWVKKKLVGRKILSVVKLVGEIWWVVGGGRALPFGPIPTRLFWEWEKFFGTAILHLSYLMIFLILNDRHNQQKFQIFQKFKKNLEFLLIMTVV